MSKTPSDIAEILTNPELLNSLAAIEHQRWAHWQAYLHDECEVLEDGSLKIPAELVQRWTRQIQTPYSELSEPEKESDREQVLKYLPTISAALLHVTAPGSSRSASSEEGF